MIFFFLLPLLSWLNKQTDLNGQHMWRTLPPFFSKTTWCPFKDSLFIQFIQSCKQREFVCLVCLDIIQSDNSFYKHLEETRIFMENGKICPVLQKRFYAHLRCFFFFFLQISVNVQSDWWKQICRINSDVLNIYLTWLTDQLFSLSVKNISVSSRHVWTDEVTKQFFECLIHKRNIADILDRLSEVILSKVCLK